MEAWGGEGPYKTTFQVTVSDLSWLAMKHANREKEGDITGSHEGNWYATLPVAVDHLLNLAIL